MAKDPKNYYLLLQLFEGQKTLERNTLFELHNKKALAIKGITTYLEEMVNFGWLETPERISALEMPRYTITNVGQLYFLKQKAIDELGGKVGYSLSSIDYELIDEMLPYLNNFGSTRLFDIIDKIKGFDTSDGHNPGLVVGYLAGEGFITYDENQRDVHWITDRGRKLKQSGSLVSLQQQEKLDLVEANRKRTLEDILLKNNVDISDANRKLRYWIPFISLAISLVALVYAVAAYYKNDKTRTEIINPVKIQVVKDK